MLPPLVLRSCLKDQSGEVIQTETERERGSLSFMMLLSPVTKMSCFFSVPSELMLLANVVDIFFRFFGMFFEL